MLHTRQALTRALWPEEAAVRNNRLDVALSNLRGKFRRAGVEQPFRHVRSVGVQLRDADDLDDDLRAG